MAIFIRNQLFKDKNLYLENIKGGGEYPRLLYIQHRDKLFAVSTVILFNYHLTIAFTAASPSTATTTTPAGAAIVALSDVRTVLATV